MVRSPVQRGRASGFLITGKIDGPVKSRKTLMIVIPAKDGIQLPQRVIKRLNTGYHR